MSFKNLPTQQKLIFLGHAISAVSTLVLTIANLVMLSEQEKLNNIKPVNQDQDRARDYFGRYQ